MYLAELLKFAVLVADVEEQDVVLIPRDIATWADYNMVVRREMWDKVYVEYRGREPDVEIITRVFTSNPSQEMYRRVAEEPAFKTTYSALRLALDESAVETGEEEESNVKPMRDPIDEEFEHPIVGAIAELADDIDLQEAVDSSDLSVDRISAENGAEEYMGRNEVNDPFAEPSIVPEMDNTRDEESNDASAAYIFESVSPGIEIPASDNGSVHEVDWISTVYEDILMTGRVIGDIPEWAAPCVETYSRMLNDYNSIFTSQSLATVLSCNGRTSAGMVEEWNATVGINCGRTVSDTDFLEADKFIQLIRTTFVESLRCCKSGDFSRAVAYIRVFSGLIYNE